MALVRFEKMTRWLKTAQIFCIKGNDFWFLVKVTTIKNEICFCIGETTAEALEEKEITNIVIAEEPSVENVIDEVIAYYNN